MSKSIYAIIALLFAVVNAQNANAAMASASVIGIFSDLGSYNGSVTTIPARFRGVTTSGARVTKLLVTAMPPARAAKMGMLGVTIAGLAMHDYIYEQAQPFFASRGYLPDEDGSFYTRVTQYRMEPINPEDKGSILANCSVDPSRFRMPTDVFFFQTYGAASTFSTQSPYTGGGGISVNATAIGAMGYSCYATYAPSDANPKRTRLTCWSSTKVANNPYNVDTPVTDAELEAAIGGALGQNDPDANDLMAATAEAFGRALASGDSNAQSSPKFKEALDQMSQSLSDDQLAQMEADAETEMTDEGLEEWDEKLTNTQMTANVIAALQAQGLSAKQIADAINSGSTEASGNITQAQVQAAMSASLASAGISSAGITDAVKTAVNDADGAIEPTEPVIPIPEKLSLTSVLQSFLMTVNNLPMLQTLRGLTINVSGSSQLCLNLPDNLGGTVCYDASGMQDSLNMIGSALLGLVSILSFANIFRS